MSIRLKKMKWISCCAVLFSGCYSDFEFLVTPTRPATTSTPTTAAPTTATATTYTPAERSNAVPEWISPESLRVALIEQQTRAGDVLAMTEAELASVPAEAFTDVLSVLNPSSPFVSDGTFRGLDGITVSAFGDAWKEIAVSSRIDSADLDACLELFFSFWIVRPVWFIPSASELRKTRDCTSSLLTVIAAASDSLRDQANLLAQAAVQLIRVAYSANVELYLRQGARATRKIPSDNERFQSYIAQKSNIADMLLHASSEAPDLPSFTDADIKYVQRLAAPDAESHAIHLGDSVDFHWSTAALGRNGKAAMPLWRLYKDNADGTAVFEFDNSKKQIAANPIAILGLRFTLFRSGMGAGRSAWLATVGAFVNERAEAVTPCLPPSVVPVPDLSAMSDVAQLFYAFEAAVEIVPGFYRCIVDGVDAGSIPLRPDDSESLGVVLHMARVATSVEALVSAA